MSVQYPQKEVQEITYLIGPNLGHPLILNIDSDLKNDRFQTDLLFISSFIDTKEFENSIKNKLFLIPILEYKWKLKFALEKAKKELISKKKNFWGRWKEKRREKKLKKKKKEEDIDILKKLKPRTYRGDPISVSILNVEQTSILDIDDLNYEEYRTPRKYLIKHKVFKNTDIFYRVKIEFLISFEILEFLKHRNFVMFDINHKMNGSKSRINYHSIVISKQDWNNYAFVHATDLHVAERNDEIYGMVKNWKKLFGLIYLDMDQKNNKTENSGDKTESEKIQLEESHKPLKHRFINPNNQLRLFIKEINRKVNQNKIDFIVLTGDLVDFSILPGLPKDLDYFYNYENSNWKIFKEIILNKGQKKEKGIYKGEELLCPIYTIPGNHDYRPFHYDFRWGGLYKKMGLNATEAIALNDKFAAFPISSIIKSKKSLITYWTEINADLDFYFKLGRSNFIFLNTGSDSFSNLTDFLSGHPSLTGVTKKQITYIENLVNHKIKPEENTFLFLHAPVINPRKQIGILKRIKSKFGSELLTRLEEFRESILKKLEKKTSKMRIDKKFNVKYGTISTNWEKIVKFCKEYCTLTLTGHTHELKEFRLGDTEEEKRPKTLEGSPFSLKKVEDPAAIYYDNYSEIFTNAEDLQKYGPFVVQTPALGFAGYHDPRQTGAYREVEVKNGKFSSFKVKYLQK